jgi:predicted metal-dependent phosphoesterase TrpH
MKKSKKADLHLHTDSSDGLLSPQELFEKIKKVGLTAVAVTDHDSVAAIDQFKRRTEMAAIKVVPAVELSGEFEGLDIHILGYCIKYHNKQFLDYLYLFQRRRYQRAQEMVEKFEKLGVTISIDRVSHFARNGPIGRPHIADALVENGIVRSRNEAFKKYLNNDGPVYVEKYKITASEVIELIHSIGGAAFVAHPGISCEDEIIYKLAAEGLDGIEVVHPKHSSQTQTRLKNLAKNLSLLECGGSDYHGYPERDKDLGNYTIPYEYVERIEQYCEDTREEWGYHEEEAEKQT